MSDFLLFMNEEDAVVEDEPDPVFDGPIQNKNPAVVTDAFSSLGAFLSTYGWFCVAAVIILWFLKGLLEEKLAKWQQQKDDAEAHKTDSAEALKHAEELLAARAKLQQRYDEIAAQQAEKQRQREEEMRKQKVDDWESHLKGGTSKASKERAEAMSAIGGMMGNSSGGGGGGVGSCSYRPGRPGGRRGGPS